LWSDHELSISQTSKSQFFWSVVSKLVVVLLIATNFLIKLLILRRLSSGFRLKIHANSWTKYNVKNFRSDKVVLKNSTINTNQLEWVRREPENMSKPMNKSHNRYLIPSIYLSLELKKIQFWLIILRQFISFISNKFLLTFLKFNRQVCGILRIGYRLSLNTYRFVNSDKVEKNLIYFLRFYE
jgi:hypothetical protein